MAKYKMIPLKAGTLSGYGNEVSGRCRKCNIRFIWPRRYGKLSDMNCPQCGIPLRGTTYLFQGKTVELVKI